MSRLFIILLLFSCSSNNPQKIQEDYSGPIIEIKNLNTFLPKTTGIEVNKPSQAFLEKVKNAANPVDIRKLKAKVFLNKLLPLSINNAKQNGQTKFSQDAA